MKFSTGKATIPVEIDGETYLFKSALSLPLGQMSDIAAFIPAVGRLGKLDSSDLAALSRVTEEINDGMQRVLGYIIPDDDSRDATWAAFNRLGASDQVTLITHVFMASGKAATPPKTS